MRIRGTEEQANRVLTRRRQGSERTPVVRIDDAAKGAFASEQFVGNLQEDAGTIAGLALGAGGAAVLHALERTEAAVYQIVGRFTPEVGQKADAAGVVLEAGIVKALGGLLGHLVAVVHRSTPFRKSRGHEDAPEGVRNVQSDYA